MTTEIRGFIGVVHLPALPGDPGYGGEGTANVVARAMADANALVQGGVDGLLIENFGSVPFRKGTDGERIEPHQVAIMTLVAARCRDLFPGHIGVNCLRNDAHSALGIAVAVGLDFIRVNVHTGAYVTDQGLIEGEAASTLRYRSSLRADDIAILADVLVKHASPLTPTTPTAATQECLERGKADGVIVTGGATGSPVDPEVLAEIARAAGDDPVFVGSGTTPESARVLRQSVQGAIVGTWLKKDGVVHAPVDQARVEKMAKALSTAG